MTGEEWIATAFEEAIQKDSIAYRSTYECLRGTLWALHECEVLDDVTLREAGRRMKQAQLIAQERVRSALYASASQAEFKRSLTAGRLRYVHAANEVLVNLGGLTAILCSVEQWTERTHLLIAAIPHERQVLQEDDQGSYLLALQVELADDIGTIYRNAGASVEFDRFEWRMIRTFMPGAPTEATILHVDIRHADGARLSSVEIPTRKVK